MLKDTEKLTINIGVVELAQIDVLVEQGIYSNRSDCIRTALREHLKEYRERMETELSHYPTKSTMVRTVGIHFLTRDALERMAAENQRLCIRVIGMLVIESSVKVALLEATIEEVTVKGKLVASDEVKRYLQNKK